MDLALCYRWDGRIFRCYLVDAELWEHLQEKPITDHKYYLTDLAILPEFPVVKKVLSDAQYSSYEKIVNLR